MNDTTAADQPRSQSEHGSDATDKDRTSVCTFEKKLHGTPPDVTARAYDTRKRQLSIFVLENHEFDSQVFQALMNIEATLIIPVAQPQCLRRQTPDWKTLHEELSDENE
ncbi:hypothetical protein POSPLADRAFT_1053678 [Postia placenta MAD-698-R-SB12]|uniref:Uncharacterized protein n=1 Tax=Postia placenta MAD-698-R-SB12 TaxID=670580 RepID=A0A1X6N8D4_9APHY|nr:hypothetical protein POSPLADRAFT_1053678 [Postia placenta MAD-698-R-SB12]OSX64871.1 hypothetical protein POSPLADRAFT_1053678 [Postia placenta MAD-698-R-SB12]